MLTCKIPDCDNLIENKDTGLCASHAHEQRKLDRMKLKEKKPINKISRNRTAQMQRYLKLKKSYLELYPVCEVLECHYKSVEIHHMAGRENDRLTDTRYFLAVCSSCHERITRDSKWAVENGYSIKRTTC